MCILAGAGTGKTRAITHRIAYAVRSGAVPAGRCSPSRSRPGPPANCEPVAGLGAGGVQARTFHAAALRQLRYFAPRVLGGAMPQVVDNPMRLVVSPAAHCGCAPIGPNCATWPAEIEWAKSRWSRRRSTRPRPRGPVGSR